MLGLGRKQHPEAPISGLGWGWGSIHQQGLKVHPALGV